MGRLRSRWARGLLLWTLALLVVGALLAGQAILSLYDAQQACFFQSGAVPCPAGDDPRVARITFAFVGIPLVWLAGVGLAAVAWATAAALRSRRRRGGH
jgi:hypothetical protein